MTNKNFSRSPLSTAFLLLVTSLLAVTPGLAFENKPVAVVDEPPPARVLGSLSFPTMAESQEAQAAFIQGMLLLHLFEYPLAREQFVQAQKLEPDFAMAVWGEAMTHNHPVWGRQNRKAARLALLKLGDTPNERQDSTPAARERLLIASLETLYGDGPKSERDRAYMRKMEQLAGRFPEDHEIQLFYALSVFGVHAGVRDTDSYMLATAISDAVFAENPMHPGAAHYLIHGVDDPVHAVLGLRAARALAEMAPDAPHAQHMTSHIFTALGMWDDVVIANEAAKRVFNANRAADGLPPTNTGHYNAWLIYGYLQQGRIDKARELLEAAYIQATESGKPPGNRLELHPDRSIVGSATQMWLRYLIETGDWDSDIGEWTFKLGDAFDPNLNFNYAQAMRSAHASLPSRAYDQLQQFRRLKVELSSLIRGQPEPSPKDLLYLERLEVMEQQILAMIEAAKGEYGKAIPYALQASVMEGELPRSYGPPYVDLPSAQLLGDLLAADSEPARAAEAYQLELQRNRQRTAALKGLIEAQNALGQEEEARFYRQKLALIWHLADDVVNKQLD
jgi:tetratricopeptide (TPR) repeat protein